MTVLDMFRLDGRIALVTGGAGKLGKQIVEALSEAGAKVYIASRIIEKLEQVAAYHRESGHAVTAVQLDQGDEESVLKLRDRIMSQEGRVDILVNNASVKAMKDWNDGAAAFAESLKINATGLYMMTRAFGNEMAKRKKGSIINIGSVNGMAGPDRTLFEGTGINGYIPDYYFNKGGMLNFTRFVASYYGPYNVRCNCVSPSGFLDESTPEKFAENYRQRIFLGRMMNSTDLKGVIVFLASDASEFITGVNIPVDGGYTAK